MLDEIRKRHPDWGRRQWFEATLDVLVLACLAWLVVFVALLVAVIVWQLL